MQHLSKIKEALRIIGEKCAFLTNGCKQNKNRSYFFPINNKINTLLVKGQWLKEEVLHNVFFHLPLNKMEIALVLDTIIIIIAMATVR